jgi:hypothetical protein
LQVVLNIDNCGVFWEGFQEEYEPLGGYT